MSTTKEIKGLFVTHYRELYGANKSLLQLMLELREKGIRPTVLLPNRAANTTNDIVEELSRHGIPFIETSIRIDKHRDWKKVVANYILASLEWRKAYEAVKRLNFDFVHSNSSVMSTGSYIAHKTGKPHIWHLREFGCDDYGVRTPFGKWFQRFIYAGDNTFIAISENIRKHYSKYIDHKKIRRIYNGIPILPASPRLISNDRVEICIVGFVRPEKGQMELLMASDLLVNQRGIRDFHITIVGEGDERYMEEIRAFITRHNLSDFITLAGRRDNVAQLLSKMDIGVMASTREAFGRVTVEYMMAGVAVVASDGGANMEIIDNGHTGMIYPSGDISALTDSLETLIINPQVRDRLAEEGKKHALANFSSKANSHAVFSLYQEILKIQ